MVVKEYRKSIENDKVTIIASDGIENFKEIPLTYYREYDGVILAFDLTNRKSFEYVPNWLETL